MSDSKDETSSRRTMRPRGSSSRPRKRATRKSVAATVKVSAPKPEVMVPESNEIRKAPTNLAVGKAKRARKNKQSLVIFSLLILGLGSSAAVGLTDEGQIDVQKTIHDRNERIKNNQANQNDTMVTGTLVPVQDTSAAGKPDGGLIGIGADEVEPEPTPVVSTTTASSSEGVSSSTVEINEESNDADIDVENDLEPVVED